MNNRSIGLLTAAAVFGVMAISCGGSDSPTAPSGGGGGGGGNSPIGATITISSSGVSPNNVTVPVGSRVTFVNNDSRSHQPASDPHPNHGSCPAIDDVGFIGTGQSRTSGNLNTPGTCSYHDHINDDDARQRGTIRVQ